MSRLVTTRRAQLKEMRRKAFMDGHNAVRKNQVTFLTGGISTKSNQTTTAFEDGHAIARDTKVASCPKEAATNLTRPTSVKFLYLIRHGEATHNVVEKEAQAKAAAEAEALGIQRGGDAEKAMMEMARKAALRDLNQTDPELSSLGREQALNSRSEMSRLISNVDSPLPKPSMVFVSPLQRALQTAALVFPNHPKVRVHGILQERQTGFACDKPSSATEMCRHEAFSFMDFGIPLKEEAEAIVGNNVEEYRHGCAHPVEPRRYLSESNVFEPETVVGLRRRTAKIGELLWNAEDGAVCVVSHKGFLRELEREELGRPEAKEFRPAEIRVYEVWQDSDRGLGAVLRHCEGILQAKAPAVETQLPPNFCRLVST
jgi:broad specificity phosphatase PhoE